MSFVVMFREFQCNANIFVDFHESSLDQTFLNVFDLNKHNTKIFKRRAFFSIKKQQSYIKNRIDFEIYEIHAINAYILLSKFSFFFVYLKRNAKESHDKSTFENF